MIAPVAPVQPTPRSRFLKAVEVTSAFLTVFVIGSVASVSAYFGSYAIAVAAKQGDFLPLLAVIGTASVLFVGWKIVSPSRGRS
jgi:hypothetical protein